MQDKLIEAVAKAIFNRRNPKCPNPWEEIANDHLKEEYRADAIAAVRAHDAGTDERLRKAAHNLAVALEQCEKPINGAFGLAQIHGMDYTEGGRWSYGVELDELKRSLQNLPPASHAAEDPAEPGEDVVSRMCKAFKCSEDIWRQEMTAALAVAREGYVKQQDVEKALYAGRYKLGFLKPVQLDEVIADLHARLAPKEPSSIKPTCRECGASVGDHAQHAKWHAALVERRTK